MKMNRQEKKRRGKHKTKQKLPKKKNKTPVRLLITESKPNVNLPWLREKKNSYQVKQQTEHAEKQGKGYIGKETEGENTCSDADVGREYQPTPDLFITAKGRFGR